MLRKLPILLVLLSVLLPGYAAAADDYVPTLITDTPYEGRQLAIKLARKSIGRNAIGSGSKKAGAFGFTLRTARC